MSRPEKRSAPIATSTHTEASPGATGYGCLTRLVWLLWGGSILLFIWISILSHRGSSFSIFDGAFWATAALLVSVRYVDITRMNGQTASGEPATLAHWRRYVAMLVSCSTGA